MFIRLLTVTSLPTTNHVVLPLVPIDVVPDVTVVKVVLLANVFVSNFFVLVL